MKVMVFLLFCLAGISCGNQETNTCTISKKEEIFNNYVDSLYISKSEEEMLPIVEEHLRVYPNNVVSINNLATFKTIIYNENPTRDKQLEKELLDLFYSVLEFCPNYKASLLNLVVSHFNYGNYEKAIEIGNMYLENYPEKAELLAYMSDSYRELSDFNSCLKFAERGINLDSTSSSCHTMKGIALYELGNPNEAISAFKISEQIKPKDLNNLFLGIIYKEGGQPGPAIEFYKKALELDSTRILTFLSLAELYRNLGATNLACKYYRLGFEKNYSKNNLRSLGIIRKEKARFKNLCST